MLILVTGVNGFNEFYTSSSTRAAVVRQPFESMSGIVLGSGISLSLSEYMLCKHLGHIYTKNMSQNKSCSGFH